MSSVDLRSIQTPLKERYRNDPASAEVVTAARSVPFDPSDPQHFLSVRGVGYRFLSGGEGA